MREDFSYKTIEKEQVKDFFKNQTRWNKAFPSPHHELNPQQSDYTKQSDDFDLAYQKLPRLYVDPKIFALERAILARNLGIKEIPSGLFAQLMKVLVARKPKRTLEAIFNFFSLSLYGINSKDNSRWTSRNRDDKGAYLWLLSRASSLLTSLNPRTKKARSNKTIVCLLR